MKRIHYLLLCSLMMFLAACEKDTLPVQFAPGVTTGNATNIYRKGAVLSGSIQLGSTATAKSYGILFSELESMAEYTEYAVTDGSKDFSVSLSTLNPGTTYYYSAYANSGYTMKKGQVKSFTTPASNAPIFAEVTLVEKDEFSCKVSVSLVDEGGSEITLSGFCWTKQGEGIPTTDSHIHNVAISGNSMTAVIEGLEPGSAYQVRAYATNSDGVGYSEVATIQTDDATAPVLSAVSVKDSTDFSVTVEAQVTDAGTSPVSKAGFCWSTTNKTPTVDDSKNDLIGQLADGNTAFNAVLGGLAPSSTYYIRAYATNEQGTSYSEVFTFTTAKAEVPALSAITQKASSDFSVTIEAEVTDGGNSAVTKAGFCWSVTNEAPTTEDRANDLTAQLADGNTAFNAVLSELVPDTTYYIRAYATNDAGTAYSEVFTFTTAEVKAPALSAITQKASSDFSVTIEAEVTDGGNSAVTKAGFCWSTENKEPTVDDTTKDLADQLTDENKKLSAALTELNPGSTYYIRAYATNDAGTAYSEVFTFTTAEVKAPALSAITQKASSDFSVTIEAEVTDGGTSTVTKVGFCWSITNETPTTEDSANDLTAQLADGNTAFNAVLSELVPNTTYYIRAYATNEVGTTYSEVFAFTTAEAKTPTLSAITQKESSDFSVTIEAEVTDGGNSAVTKAGFCWSTENKEPTVDDTTKDLTDQLTDENKKLSVALTELNPGSTYYIRAYATNSFGTTYSEVFTFKTPYKDAGNGNTGINSLPTTEWK